MNKARVESFSDGVFAFAITLLVPPRPHGSINTNERRKTPRSLDL